MLRIECLAILKEGMDMEQLSLGIIGYGSIASVVHSDALRRIPGVVVSAIAETDESRQAEAQKDWPSAHCCADYQELLDLPEVQAVIIAVPTALHVEVALSAIAHGKHIYLEKPLATKLAASQAVVTAWQESNIIGMMGFNLRFHPLYLELKQQIASGVVGRIVAIQSLFHTGGGRMPAWKKKRESGGGVLLDLASHQVDLLPMLFDSAIVSLTAQLQSQRTEDDNALLSFEMANGLAWQSSLALNSFDLDRLEIIGEDGMLTVDRHHSLQPEKIMWRHLYSRGYALRRGIRESLTLNAYARAKFRAPRLDPSYLYSMQHFINALRQEKQAAPSFSDGYRALEIVLAAEESARSGQRILINHESFVD